MTKRMHTDCTRLFRGQTVGEALEGLRRHPPPGRIVYFYVVDTEGRLEGVLPTRRLILSPPDRALADIMIRQPVALPARATVLEACEFFIQFRLLAFPVVDDQGRLVGAVDIELYTDELGRLNAATPFQRWVRPLTDFLAVQSSSGLILLACAALALALANSPWSDAYAALWHTPVRLGIGDLELGRSLHEWINDGLMTVFFFVVGLEIKREVLTGELSDPRKAALPVVAALGGMLAPAAIYLACRWGRPGEAGWGIPMATDIAFVVGFLALLGARVPTGLKVLLLSLAIADDIGAALVIALAYSGNLSPAALAVAAAGVGLVLLCQRVGVRAIWFYAVLAGGVWLAVLRSGIHPTVTGAVLGLLTPSRPWLGDRVPLDLVADMFRRFAGESRGASGRRGEAVSPLERLERALHPWVAFGIMPLFALANAGVALEWAALTAPVALAVAAGLVVGKPLGIVTFSALAVRIGIARLPEEVSWKVLVGAGCLAGIGFTMSLFVAGLALQGSLLEEAKIGILAGSVVSTGLGMLLLSRFLPPPVRSAEPAQAGE